MLSTVLPSLTLMLARTNNVSEGGNNVHYYSKTSFLNVIQGSMSLAHNCMLLRVGICDGGHRSNELMGHSFPIKVTSSVVIGDGGHS